MNGEFLDFQIHRKCHRFVGFLIIFGVGTNSVQFNKVNPESLTTNVIEWLFLYDSKPGYLLVKKDIKVDQ